LKVGQEVKVKLARGHMLTFSSISLPLFTGRATSTVFWTCKWENCRNVSGKIDKRYERLM